MFFGDKKSYNNSKLSSTHLNNINKSHKMSDDQLNSQPNNRRTIIFDIIF